ncbi:Uncharacterised protein [Mycobacterium tuberculosis]|nr:Uncharacterised protein [Mycobacterium tuberculosis]
MVEAAVGGAEADPRMGAGAPRRRRRKVLVAVGVFLAVLAMAVGGGLAWAVILPNVQGRGEYEVVPHAAKVLDTTDGLDRRITSKLTVQADRGWYRTGTGHYTNQSWVFWSAFTGLVQVNVEFKRYEATALKSGAEVAAAELDKRRNGYTRPRQMDGLGNEAIGAPVTEGFEVRVRDRNVLIWTSFSAPSKKSSELEAYARPMAQTALALLEQANR